MEVSSKELLAVVKEIGLNIKSHSSNLEAGEVALLQYAMKEILEEKKAKEEKKAAEKAKKKTTKKKAAKKKTTKKKAAAKMTKKAAKKTTKKTEKKSAGDEEIIDEAEGAVAVAEAPEDEHVGEEKPGTAAEKSEESVAVADKEKPSVEEDIPKTKKETSTGKRKLKKIAKRRPSATILGRINLDAATIEAHKKAKERKRKDKPAEPGKKVAEKSGPKLDLDQMLGGKTGVDRTFKKEFEPETKSEGFQDDKVQKVIKPKQSTIYVDADDPILQDIRIGHWDRRYKTRRPVFRGSRTKKAVKKTVAPLPDKKVDVQLPVTVKELSHLLGIRAQQILISLMKKGEMAHINSVLEEEDVIQLALDFNKEVEVLEEKDLENEFFMKEGFTEETRQKGNVSRPPIVTLLGHVDHGKTSLLDTIRKTDVVATEEGGITQHISAYMVTPSSGKSITFLDTPGHKAFTEMRARGANVTDIVILVVAGDDGVMPQTEEAIQHAQAAGVPIVVAVNKMDKPDANAQKVKQQLAGQGVMTEDWGGEVGCVEVSAQTGQGLDDLLDRLALEAEMLEIGSHPDSRGRGVVIESRKDDVIGNVVTLLVTDGTVRLRDNILAGDSICRARNIIDDKGKKIESAGPALPINVQGFETLPNAGERFVCVEDIDEAREIAKIRRDKERADRLAPDRSAITLENLFESIEAGKVAEIRIVVKADVKGSLEVLLKSFEEMKHEEVKIKIVRSGVGAITEEDVLLAVASDAIIIGFRVIPDTKARKLIEENRIDLRTYRVIYKLLEDVRLAMEGALKPIEKERVTAHIEIRQVFKSSRLGNIAGCYVTDGTIRRSNGVRLVREGVVIYEGEIESLRHIQDDRREIKEGYECGVKIKGYNDIKTGDVIESFEIVKEKRTLSQEAGGTAEKKPEKDTEDTPLPP